MTVVAEVVDGFGGIFHGCNPPQETRTFVRIDTEARTCRVHQEDSRYELTQKEFENVIVVHPLPYRPDVDTLEAWLEGGVTPCPSSPALAKTATKLPACCANW